jgi:hypothetical protein
MSDFLSREESRELIRLCQTGRLHDVRSWIEAGKSLRTAPEIKKTILSVAVKTGFHSLVELIAPQESQEAKNQGLADAVRLNRLDLVELLISLGADIKAVPFSDVLLNWHPQIIRFFINHGADLIMDSPFANAFGEKIRTALRPFMECKQRFPDLADALQEQADRALRKFAYEGDLKWVSLLTWAGADPRSRGIRLGDENFGTEEDRPEIETTALMEACYQKNLDVLKKLKIDPKHDNLSELLACASTLSSTEIIKYLLGLGTQANDKANGGSSALDRCLGHLAHEDFDAVLYKRPVSRWKVQNTMDSLKVLVNHGAFWKPDNPRKMDCLRRDLWRAEPEIALDLLEFFVKTKCCSEETLHELLRTPRIRQHLKPLGKKLIRLGLDLRTARERAEQAHAEAVRRTAWLLSCYNREQLYEEIWSEPLRMVAKKYGFSDVRLGKVCKALNIPKPGVGYWAKKAAGKFLGKPPPLPPLMPALDT